MSTKSMHQPYKEREFYEREVAANRDKHSRALAAFYIAMIDGEIVRRATLASMGSAS